jgi:hypothetical protein
MENGHLYVKHDSIPESRWQIVTEQNGGSTDQKLLKELPEAFNRMIERDLLGEDSEQ